MTSPEINFLDIFHNENDKTVLRQMTTEIIRLYGFPCHLKRWVGIQPVLDPIYQDSPTIFDTSDGLEDGDLWDTLHTHVYIDYNRFNSVLHSYGLAIEPETSLTGMMIFDDHPKEDDLIEIHLPYDNKEYRFKIGSTDIHRDLCYSVILNIYHKESGDV